MQLFEVEHIGRRRLGLLRDILLNRYPQVDAGQLAVDCGVKSDWSMASRDENGSMQAVLRVMHTLRRGAVPDIALQLGDRAQITDSGLLGYAVLTAPTVLQAARMTSHALSSSNYLLRNKIVVKEQYASSVFSVTSRARPHREMLMEMSMLAVWRCIQSIVPSGRASTPAEVHFSHPAPDYAARYEELFGCPVYFDRAHDVLITPSTLIHQRIPSGNTALIRSLSTELRELLGDGYRGSGIAARVRRALVENPQSCAFSLTGTAAQLNMHPRSLRRYLADQGHSFREVCQEARMALAKQYLSNTQMPVKAIALQLGYRHSNNFTRAFAEYFGETPEAARRREFADQDASANPAR